MPRSSATSRLAASGLLNRKIGGESVQPPAPAFLFLPPASYGPKTWVEATGPDRYRRALYTFRYRSVPYPMLQTFDAPNGDFSCVRRCRSNTPLQALTLLNEPVFLESARALALTTLKEGGATDADRLTYAFRRCLAQEAHGRGGRDPARPPHARDEAIRQRGGEPVGPGRRQARGGPPASSHRDARPACRLDRRRPRPAEPR